MVWPKCGFISSLVCHIILGLLGLKVSTKPPLTQVLKIKTPKIFYDHIYKTIFSQSTQFCLCWYAMLSFVFQSSEVGNNWSKMFHFLVTFCYCRKNSNIIIREHQKVKLDTLKSIDSFREYHYFMQHQQTIWGWYFVVLYVILNDIVFVGIINA